MHRRVNITLPEETLALIDRATARGDRSRFIDQAVKYFVRARGQAKLRQLLKQGAEKRAERDLTVASEWFALDDGPWRRSKK